MIDQRDIEELTMDQHASSELANEFARFYTALADYGDGQASEIRAAVFLHARNLLPSAEAAVVIEHTDGIPVLLAVHNRMLTVIDARPDEEHKPAETRQRVFPLDPMRCRAEVKVQFAGSNTFGHFHRSTWKIQVDEFSAEFTGRTDEAGNMDPKAALGNQVAVALGWRHTSENEAAKAA
jgi:hypothetical protein